MCNTYEALHPETLYDPKCKICRSDRAEGLRFDKRLAEVNSYRDESWSNMNLLIEEEEFKKRLPLHLRRWVDKNRHELSWCRPIGKFSERFL